MAQHASPYFPDEAPTTPRSTLGARPPRSAPDGVSRAGARPGVDAARPPLETTSYSIVPGRWSEDEDDTSVEAVCIPRLDPLPWEARASVEAETMEAERDRIDTLYRALTTMTHYELLGVDARADGAALRQAHALLVATLHTERYVAADAILRRKLEIILAGVQHAYETLASPWARARYERSLAETG
jgi:hypothetical protein